MDRKLIVKENNKYRIATPLLLMFSTSFIVWQMGVLYFAGNTMSLFGRTPIPLVESDTTMVIAAGYVCSIFAMIFFPRYTVYMERFMMPIALVATMLMILPLSVQAITILFYISAFGCVFSIGTMLSIGAQHFTVDTTWRDGILSMFVGGIIIAFLQNDIFKVSFTVFIIFSIFLIAAQAAFYYIIPAKIEATYVTRANPVKMPKIVFFGIWFIVGAATLLLCFASSYAESMEGGVSLIYSSAAIAAVILYSLRKKLGATSIRVFGVFFALAVLGFVLAFLSLRIPSIKYIACGLLGLVVVLANLWIYFAAVAFQSYPTKFIGVIGAAMGLILAAIHSGLLDWLRDDLALLCGIYAALSVALMVIYYFMEPYFTRMWNKRIIAKDDIDNRLPQKAFKGLSEQENILAELILGGHTDSTAAEIMNISLNTEKSYRKNLYTKLDIHSRRELFELAKKQ